MSGNKWLIYICGFLLLAVGFTTWFSYHEAEKLGATKVQLADIQKSLKDAQTQAQVQQTVAKVTDDTITVAIAATKETTKKAVVAKATVDKITKQVTDEKISSTDADRAYSDSMWVVYCEAQPTDGACASRQSAN